MNPYTTSALSAVKFYATTSCPTAINIAKRFQSLLKGDKAYTPKEISLTPGNVSCSYSLQKTGWQKALNTSTESLILTASIPTREHANYWRTPLVGVDCPVLTANHLQGLKQGSVEVQKTREPKLTYVFKVMPIEKDGVIGHLQGLFSGSAGLPNLTGKAQIIKDFEVVCHYTHHTGGKENLLELKGTILP